MAEQLVLESDTVLRSLKQHILCEFGRALTEHAMSVTRHSVNLSIGRFSSTEPTIDKFSTALDAFLSGIDPKAIYDRALADATGMSKAADYEGVLRIFNKKDLVTGVDRFFGIGKGTYVEKVREMAKRGIGSIRLHMLAYLPDMVGKLPVVQPERPVAPADASVVFDALTALADDFMADGRNDMPPQARDSL